VVTFNYDRVPDLLEKQEGKLKIILPCENLQTQIEEAREDETAPVLKVHAVDWMYREGALSQPGPEAALCQRLDVLLGVPGPQKRSLVKHRGGSEAPLQALWNQMRQEIREAARIFFVGYRFPPTDSDARSDRLGGIRENTARVLKILTVLGPDTGNRNSARLLALLRAVDPENRDISPTVHALPFFAEDFLSLYGAGVNVTGLKS
jgi:hypothetical protein